MADRHLVEAAEGQLGKGWAPRKDAAVLANCSEDTVKRYVRKHGLQTQRPDPHGPVLVFIPELVSRGFIKESAAGRGDDGAAAAEIVRLRERIVELESRLAAATARYEVVADREASRLAEIERKDALLATLGRSTEALLVHLSTAEDSGGGR